MENPVFHSRSGHRGLSRKHRRSLDIEIANAEWQGVSINFVKESVQPISTADTGGTSYRKFTSSQSGGAFERLMMLHSARNALIFNSGSAPRDCSNHKLRMKAAPRT